MHRSGYKEVLPEGCSLRGDRRRRGSRKIVALLREHAVDIDPFPKFWKGSRNGRLLKLIGEAGYDWFLTNDKNMEYQQNLHGIPFSIIVLPTPALDEIEPNPVVIVDAITGLVAPSLIRLRFPVGGRERY